jgi:signal transduction histidine kinase/ActR/RegA family two-component response regulator
MDGETEHDGHPRWRLVLGIFLALSGAATIVALVLMLGAATKDRDTALDSRRQSYEAMILARSLDASIGQAEAFLGRFVISGDKDLGRLYLDDWRRAGTQIDALDQMVTDPRTQSLIEQLHKAYDARGKELSAIALRTNYGQNPAALYKYYQAGKSPTLGQIDGLLEAVIAAQRDTLAERGLLADASIKRSNTLGLVVSFFGLLLVFGAAILGWAAVLAWRERRLEDVSNADLELAVTERTAELRQEMAHREETEAKLRQAQKMEAIGQLTGGIAHDFNNMLSVVIGGLELAQRRLASGGATVGRHIEQAMEGANRAAALTKRLLAFARSEPLLPVASDPNKLIAGMADLIERTIGDNITVAFDTDEDVWPIYVDPYQLENAVLNLAVNARDAMPDGGTLTIRTHNVFLSDGEIEGVNAGEHLCLSVADTGVGMSRDVLERAFEPFFTTKPTGKGTGLGLSQIFGFVRQSRGAVTVESVIDSGTTVSIYLPRSATDPSSEPAVPHAVSTLPRRRGTTVLVVEDDPRVLAATSDALEELGLRTVRCLHPGEARKKLRENPDIGLIVSDVLMPGMTGPELIASIRNDYPGLPVLFVTGYAGDIDTAAAFGGHMVLRKPFTLASLGKAVGTLLANDPVRKARAEAEAA